MLPGGGSPSSTVVPMAEVEYVRFKIVVIEDDDFTYAARYCACNGAGSSHPSFRWEGIDVGR